MPILMLTTRLDGWHTTAEPYLRPTTSPLSPTKHLISPERAGPEDAARVALFIRRRQAVMVAFSYLLESAASSCELMAALSVAAVDMADDTPTSFSEPMKKGEELSSASTNLTLAVAETTEVERATSAAMRTKKEHCREKGEKRIIHISSGWWDVNGERRNREGDGMSYRQCRDLDVAVMSWSNVLRFVSVPLWKQRNAPTSVERFFQSILLLC